MTFKNPEILKLEIWREIMRARSEFIPGGSGAFQAHPAQFKAPPDPVEAANKARATFDALYPPKTVLTTTKRKR